MNPWQQPSPTEFDRPRLVPIGTENQGARRECLDVIGEHYIAKEISWPEACLFKDMCDDGNYGEVYYAISCITRLKAA